MFSDFNSEVFYVRIHRWTAIEAWELLNQMNQNQKTKNVFVMLERLKGKISAQTTLSYDAFHWSEIKKWIKFHIEWLNKQRSLGHSFQSHKNCIPITIYFYQTSRKKNLNSKTTGNWFIFILSHQTQLIHCHVSNKKIDWPMGIPFCYLPTAIHKHK